MDIQAEKLNLIEWLTRLTDERVLAKIKTLQNEEVNESLVAEEESDFDLAYSRAEKDKAEGRVKSHTEVRKKYDKWL